MFSMKTLAALAIATTAVMAAPQIPVTTCGNGQTYACCNPGQGGDLLGLTCTAVGVAGGAVQHNCGQDIAACCPQNSATGNIIIQANCDPISI